MPGSSVIFAGAFPELLGVDVDDQRCEQDEPADQDLQERSIWMWSRPLFKTPSTKQADDGVADAAAPAEERVPPTTTAAMASSRKVSNWFCCADAEIGHAEHAGDAGADGADHHHRSR